MGKKKKGFTIRLNSEEKIRTEYHRPTRSMKDRRDELHYEDLGHEMFFYDDEIEKEDEDDGDWPGR